MIIYAYPKQSRSQTEKGKKERKKKPNYYPKLMHFFFSLDNNDKSSKISGGIVEMRDEEGNGLSGRTHRSRYRRSSSLRNRSRPSL
jgi:hypothetical protein